MAEYTRQLEDIHGQLDSLSSSVASINEALSSITGDSGVHVDDMALLDKLDTLAGAVSSATPQNVDYSQALAKVSQLLVYTDALLIVLIVFLVLGVGVFVGGKITDWLKLRQ